MGEADSGPPGHLVPKVVAAEPALARFTMKQLGSELHARLRAGAIAPCDERFDDDVEGLAALGRELLQRLDVDSDRFSRSNAAIRFEAYWGGDSFGPTSLKDETVVELGCGNRNPLSVMFIFVMLGARRAIGVDLDGVSDVPEAVRALARCGGWMLTDPKLLVRSFPITREQVAAHLAATRFDLAKLFAGDASGVDRGRLDLRQESAARLGFGDGEVDLCCSSTFLEHVPDVDAVIAETARVTKRGGRGVHIIDTVDHRSYLDPNVRPLQFLEMKTADPLVFGCNRMRPQSFGPVFERHGFEVRRTHEWRRHEVDAATRAKFVEPYRSMACEDLARTGVTFWVRRR